MKHFLAAVVAVSALTACNGGSASPPPFSTGIAQPTPSPSPTPPVVVTKSVVWTVDFKAKATSAFQRSPLAVASGEPVTIAAPNSTNGTDAATNFGLTTGVVSAVEKDSTGAVVSTAATYTSANSAVASVSTPSPDPSATPRATVNGVTIGATTTSARFPDGATSDYQVNVVTAIDLYSPPNGGAYPGQQAYYIDASGAIVSTTSKAQADVYIEGPKGTGDFAASKFGLGAPLGYKELFASKSMASISTAGFIPDGTQYDLVAGQTPQLWLVKSRQAGRYMAIRFVSTVVNAGKTYLTDAPACASDTSGVFSNC